MAGSRLEYISTIFSRATGLLRTKAIKYEDRPIWYDVYRVFPPKLEPRADRVPELSEGMTGEVPSILYGEDIARAARNGLPTVSSTQKVHDLGGHGEGPV